MKSWILRLSPLWLMLAAGQAFAGKSSITITLDTIAIPVGNDSIRIELLAAIPKGTPGATAPLLASVRARDKQGHTVSEFERVEPAPRDTTIDRVLSWHFPGRPGKIETRVRLKTLDDWEDTGSAETECNVPMFSKEAFYVSTPWLVTLSRDSVGQGNGGYQNLPSRMIRSERNLMAIRAIAFTRSSLDSQACNVRFVLRRGSRQVADSTFTHSLLVREPLEIREDPLQLGGGLYKYQLVFSNGTKVVKREGTFQITVGGVDLLRDPVLVRTVLGYVGTGEERLAIETAPEDSLAALWDRFWKRRDPDPNAPGNPALERFLERVDEATNRFGGVVPGWKSDRGRILIQHGRPKRTERVFDPSTRVDTEIWYYDDRNVSYVFQDAEGFGNYRLTGGR